MLGSLFYRSVALWSSKPP